MKDLETCIQEVESKIEYNFHNIDLFLQAFTRRSYTQEHGGEDNEILEFIGDEVLDFYVTKILIDKYGYIKQPGDKDFNGEEFVVSKYCTEGSLTDLKKKLVNKTMLAHRIDLLGFNDLLFMGNGDIQQHKENEPSVKEDLFEAILGAIAIDSNWDSEVLENSVNIMLNIEHYLSNGFSDEDDYVMLIQQWNQKENGEVPQYEFEESSNGNFQAYLVLSTVRGLIRYCSEGHSKGIARANVAKSAFVDLYNHNELFTIMDELPSDLTIQNSINTLQELAQKGYISMPEYFQEDHQVYDNNGNLRWECGCRIKSNNIYETAIATSKKLAKKYAAYLCICKICGLENQYE